MHGEQVPSMLLQVTESVKWMDGKFCMPHRSWTKLRHLEVFLRYLDTKLEKPMPLMTTFLSLLMT